MKHRISLWNSLAGLLVVGLSLSIAPVFAANITVTNTFDSSPGSLRDAIATASPGDTINFSLAYPTTITLGSTLLVDKSLTINGPGASNLAISGNNSVGVFYIAGGTVSISDVTIKNGFRAAASYGAYADIAGGGILNVFGTVTLTASTLSGNSATEGGGIFNDYGTVTVANCTLSGNSALNNDNGGAILNYFGTLTVTNSTLSGNSAGLAGGAGGGILNVLGTVTLTDTTLSGNSAAIGGGIDNAGTLTVTRSTISGNLATAAGGGIRNQPGHGLTLTNSTLSGNSAIGGSGHGPSYGGGVLNSGVLTIVNSTLSGNSADNGGGISNFNTLLVRNSIVANSSSGGNCFLGAPLSTHGHNLSDDATCAFSGSGDINSTLAGLNPSGLQNNGGPTKTIALLPTGPAVNAIPVSPVNYCTAVDGVTPIASDQRGVPRPQGSACDIGAFEYSAGYSICPLYEPTRAVNSGSTVPIKIQLCDSNRTDLSSPSIVVHAVQVQQVSTSITAPVQTSGNANSDNDFRYDASLGPTGGYILNLSTNGLPSGAYSLQFTATGDPVTHSVGFGVK